MKFEIPKTKESLRSKLLAFFRQRKKFAEMAMGQAKSSRIRKVAMIATSLIIKFNLIQNYNYWRHCLEVRNKYEEIYEILPSENGKQSTIREHMLQIMDECKRVSAIKPKEYAGIDRSQKSLQGIKSDRDNSIV